MTEQPQPTDDNRSGVEEAWSQRVAIRDLAREHLNAVVSLHMQAFPDFFLTFLGHSFIKQLYLAYCDDPTTIALVAVRDEGGEILGVVIGPLYPASFFKRILIRRWWRFASAATRAMLCKPSITPRVVRAVRYRGEAPDDGGERALLASIAVSPAVQGSGVGKQLIQKFLERVKAAGLRGAFLTTDARTTTQSTRFTVG